MCYTDHFMRKILTLIKTNKKCSLTIMRFATFLNCSTFPITILKLQFSCQISLTKKCTTKLSVLK